MNCFSEFAYSVYADGESPVDEARQIEAHLAVCAGCRSLVNTLRAENRMISDVMADTREELQTLPDWQQASPSRLILGALVALAGAVIGLRTVFVGLGEWGLSQLGLIEPVSAALDWINPSNWTAQVNLFFTGVYFLVNEGASMMFWLLTAIGSVVVVLALAFAGYLLARRRPARMNSMALLNVVLGALLLLGVAPRAAAVEVHQSETSYTLERGKTINDTLIIGGDSAVIDGDVNGDLIFGGRKLVVRGNVKGDVAAGTQITEIEGNVGGNVISFSQWVSITGKVGGNVYSWSQEFRLGQGGTAGGNLMSFSADSDIAGQVVRDWWAFTGKVEVSGKVGRNVHLRGDSLTISSGAVIGGDLDAQLHQVERVRIESGASIAGKQSIQHWERGFDNSSRYTQGRFYFWQVIQLLAALLMGTLLLFLCPDFYRGAVEAVGPSWMPFLRSLGLGFAILIATPVAIVLMCVTLIGIPLGVLSFMTYVVGMYFSKIFLGAMVGQGLLQRNHPQNRQDALLALFAGLVFFFVSVNLPYAIGSVVHFLVFCVGLGAFGYHLVKSLQPAPQTGPAI
jgi:predicted anti-sigma-YlaC factor YlaD/cytoskeletal protein CcmA (bactofilin family)